MTLNIIFVLIILTHAQGFESIKKYGGQGPLAAPYQSLTVAHPAVIRGDGQLGDVAVVALVASLVPDNREL